MRILNLLRMLYQWLRNNPYLRGIWLGVSCAIVAWLVTQLSPVNGLEEWAQDSFFSLRGQRPTRAHVILIGLDDESLDELKLPLLYTSPQLAEVVAFLKARKVAAIGLDVLVPKGLMADKELQEGERGDATKLGHAIQDAGNVVLAEWKIQGKWQRPLPQWQLKALIEPGPNDFGFVNLTEDDDYFLRRQQLLVREGEQAHQQFALSLFAIAHHTTAEWTPEGLRTAGELVPLDLEQELRVNYVGPPGTFPVVSFKDVLDAARNQKTLPQKWAGAVIIIGVTAHTQQDYHPTPYANNYSRYLAQNRQGLMAGSEFHANVLATLEDRAYLRTPSRTFSVGLLLVMGGVLGWSFARLNLAGGFAVAFAQHWAWKGVCFAVVYYAHWRLEVVPELVLGAFAYLLTFVYRWHLMKLMLGLVKSVSIARLLERDPDQLYLKGEERVITVFFADLRDFSAYSETHAAHDVVKLLNAFYSAIVPIIEHHGGTLNQYMGDGIMVLFGAPEACQDDALRAVRAAVAIVRQVHDLEHQWKDLGNPKLRMGVGIHRGPVVTGVVGSRKRLDYTAIGNTVNAAARIEAENKNLKTEILISSETYYNLPDKSRGPLGCQEHGHPVQVKGISRQLIVHAVDWDQATDSLAVGPKRTRWWHLAWLFGWLWR